MVVEYDFLHPGLFRGFVCAMGDHDDGTGVYWRNGLWLYAADTKTRLRVTMDELGGSSGRIEVALQGPKAPRLVQWLRQELARQNQLFGHGTIEAAVDELDDDFLTAHERSEDGPREPKEDEDRAPDFGVLPPEAFSTGGQEREAFISYAWSNGSESGRQSEAVADGLERALKDAGVHVHRDRTDMSPGDRVSAFMDRLTRGRRVFVLLSERYLQSENCMYELFGIWNRAGADGETFLGRVIPVVLPGTKIGTRRQRLAHARFWRERHDEAAADLEQDGELFGQEDFRKLELVSDFYRHVSDVLSLLNDKLEPRDPAELKRTGYADLIKQV